MRERDNGGIGGAASALYRHARTRFRMAGRAERTGWVIGFVATAPIVVPVFAALYAKRRAVKRRVRIVTQPFVPPSHTPGPRLPNPAAEATLAAEPSSFALLRVIGNDLPPRHVAGQSRANLDFILKNEPEFEGCEKIWVVNRVVDPEQRDWFVSRLEEAGRRHEVIPFDLDEYARVPLDFSLMPEPQPLLEDTRPGLPDDYAEARRIAQIHRLKNAYVMNNNGARNRAIEIGAAAGAKWILPFDGNIIMSAEDWAHLRQATEGAGHAQYLVVPMARMGDNARALGPMNPSDAREEPQMAFRRDALLRFDERHPYGRRPKVELFARLGVPGPWSTNRNDPWDLQAGPLDPGMHRVARGGMVRRLGSGKAEMEMRGTARARGIARCEGIVTLLRHADAIVLRARGYAPKHPVLYAGAPNALRAAPDGPLASAVAEGAQRAMARGPHSVTDKTELPPSGDAHDYYHPAPYWWPNPARADGLPYVWRDGERVPGTEMDSPESGRFDRTRWQMMVEDTLSCALAHAGLGDASAREHGRTLVRRWFLDATTAMAPHLRYAQVRRGHNGDEGNGTGIIELKDIAVVLDAVRLLDDPELSAGMERWLRTYADWLLHSAQGRRERRARNNHGLCFDIQLASIAAFLGDTDLLMECWMWSASRLSGHFDEEGAQPHELARTLSRHYAAYNLQNWLTLLRLYRGCGVPIEHQPELERLAAGVEWIMGRRDAEWEYEQIAPFDEERLTPISIAAADLSLGLPPAPSDLEAAVRLVFGPHDGIPPFWPLALITPDAAFRARP